MSTLSRLIAIVGPTCTGKTEAAIQLATAIGGEILNADAFQVYQGMDVGTAKPTVAEQRRCRFHLIDIVDPCSSFSVAEWCKHAERSIADIEGRGNTPILCGGAGMYLKALLQGWTLADSPRNEVLRTELHTIAAHEGNGAVHQILASCDAVSASRLHPNDLVRVIRAIEVFKTTGTPISELNRRNRVDGTKYSVVQFGFAWPRSELYSRIDNRVRTMMEGGFPCEVERLLSSGVTRECPGMRSLGYCDVADMLHGLLTKDQVIATISLKTRQYAKRQITWFKPDSTIEWLNPCDGDYLGKMLTGIGKMTAN